MLYVAKHGPQHDPQFHLTWLAIVIGFEAIAFTVAAAGAGWFFSAAAVIAAVAWGWTTGWPGGWRVSGPPARHARR